MTLFGRTFDAQEIAALVFMLAVLVLWIGVYRGERNWANWLTRWNAERKARRDAEIAAERGDPPGGAPPPRGGPWG